MYICHPVFFPLGWFSKLCYKNKQKQGRTSLNRLRITGVLMKLGFLIGNFNASCFKIDLFPFLNSLSFFVVGGNKFLIIFCGQWKWRLISLGIWRLSLCHFPIISSLDTIIHLIFPLRSSFHHSNQRQESSADSCKSFGRRESLDIWLPCVSWPFPICIFFQVLFLTTA